MKQNTSKSYDIYIKDIIKSIEKIEKYINNISKEEFIKKDLIIDAVVRNLEIIGEAVKKIPNEIKEKNKNIEWKKIAGLRDVLIHEYAGIDLDIVWEIIKEKMPSFKKDILNLNK
ncbi:MAG: DUF86 domain-containing protein [Candidatus Woesearchaeota archaeon]